ncbi:MAG: hypothetical protein ABIZ36_08265 [Gemmatimonadaceae bacterium]
MKEASSGTSSDERGPEHLVTPADDPHEKELEATRPGSLKEWLESRTPAPPPNLAERLTEIVGVEALEGPAASNVLLERGIATLRAALSDRDGALDLLAADALITYSMEAAADDCATMDATAAEAIQQIARGTA